MLVHSVLIVPPVTENVIVKVKQPNELATVPVVSTLTNATDPNGIFHPPPAVASVPWLKKCPESHAVDEVATDEIERNTILPSTNHGIFDRLAVTVCAGDAPRFTAPVNDVADAPCPMNGVMISVPVAGVVMRPPIANLYT